MFSKIVMAVSALALLGACATPQTVDIAPLEKISNELTPERADSLLQRGYYEQAAAAYKKALEKDPEDQAARYGLAEAQRLGGKLDPARENYQILTDVEDWKLRAMEGLGRIAFASGDRDLAFEEYSEIVAEDPTAWRSWLALAQLHDLAEQWDAADEAYALALAGTKSPAAVYNNHGISMMARGEPAAAADLFRSAIAADPKLAPAATNLDLAEAAAGQRSGGDARGGDARERARKLNNYGYVAMLQGRTEEAKSYYEAALKEHPSFYALAYSNLKALQTPKAGPEAKADTK